MRFYEESRVVPAEAQKTIIGGKLRGKTDINPMWRIKKLTEMFGPVGFGWTCRITDKWLEPAAQEVGCFVRCELQVKVDGKWSEPIEGIGGSSFVALEKGTPTMNDECYKMAYTDAISVACKALGMGADIYWNADRTKYTLSAPAPAPKAAAQPKAQPAPKPQPQPAPKAEETVTAPKTMTIDGNGNEELSEELSLLFIQEVQPKIVTATTNAELLKVYNSYPQLQGRLCFMDCLSNRRKEVEAALSKKK